MIQKILIFFYTLSIKGVYHLIFKTKKKVFHLPNKGFLISSDYQNIMNQFVPYNCFYGKHEAYTYTRSYINRHHTFYHKLGVFRWRGMQEHLDKILPLLTEGNKTIIDFGGAGCPLGLNSILIDRLNKDILGNKIEYNDLSEYKGQVDIVFASHVFEHIENLDDILLSIRDKLLEGGKLICMVPSFSNIYWNAGDHNHKKFGRHVWTMGLSETDKNITKDIPYYMDIDTKIAQYFKLDLVEYCGDDCIIIIAEKDK